MVYDLQFEMSNQAIAKKEKDVFLPPPIKKVKSAEEFMKAVKFIHDQSSDLGDVSKHITIESKVNSPFKVNLIEWDGNDGDESEFQRSVRTLENKLLIKLQLGVEYVMK